MAIYWATTDARAERSPDLLARLEALEARVAQLELRELRDYTRVLLDTKALETAADRLINIALRRAPALTLKADITAVGTGDAPALVSDPAATSLLSLVQRRSVLGRLGAVSVPPNRLIPVGDDDPTAVWVAEGQPVPLARVSTTSTYTPTTSYTLLIALLEEYLRLGDARARNLIISRATRALVRADDSAFLSADAASAANPAGVLFGRSPVGSGSPSDLQGDLELLYASVSNGAPLNPTFVLSGRAALYLAATGLQSFRNLGVLGGTIAGAPALISPSAAANVILIDAAEVAVSDQGLETFSSQNASIQMVDNPSTGATNVTSAFQNNMTVLKLIRYVSWALLRADAAAYLELPIGGSPQ